jgi:hypothetical protein
LLLGSLGPPVLLRPLGSLGPPVLLRLLGLLDVLDVVEGLLDVVDVDDVADVVDALDDLDDLDDEGLLDTVESDAVLVGMSGRDRVVFGDLPSAYIKLGDLVRR